jgi:hypothetical protein
MIILLTRRGSKVLTLTDRLTTKRPQQALAGALNYTEWFALHTDSRAVVIQASGPVFSSGLDLRTQAMDKQAHEICWCAVRSIQLLQTILILLCRWWDSHCCRVPAGGYFDLAIANWESKFLYSWCEYYVLQYANNAAGKDYPGSKKRAMDMLLMDDWLTQEALNYGLVSNYLLQRKSTLLLSRGDEHGSCPTGGSPTWSIASKSACMMQKIGETCAAYEQLRQPCRSVEAYRIANQRHGGENLETGRILSLARIRSFFWITSKFGNTNKMRFS